MRGREKKTSFLSFENDEDDQRDIVDVDDNIITIGEVKNSKTTESNIINIQKSKSKTMRGIQAKTSSLKEHTEFSISKVRDLAIGDDDRIEHYVDTIYHSFDNEKEMIDNDNDNDNDIKTSKAIEQAKNLRAQKRKEALLDDYISLENTTQKYLDDYDITTMIRQERGERPRLPTNTWEDPDDVDRDVKKRHSLDQIDSESAEETDQIKKFDDGLDEEVFDAHRERIQMQVIEKDENDKIKLKDVEEFEDEETRTWELQQIRKGAASAAITTSLSKQTLRAAHFIEREATIGAEINKLEIPLLAVVELSAQFSSDTAKVNQSIINVNYEMQKVLAHKNELQRSITQSEQTFNNAIVKKKFLSSIYDAIQEFSASVDQIIDPLKEFESMQISDQKNERTNNLPPLHEQSSNDDDDDDDGEKLTIDDEPIQLDPILMDKLKNHLTQSKSLLEKLDEWKERNPQTFKDSSIEASFPLLFEKSIEIELFMESDLNCLDTNVNRILDTYGGDQSATRCKILSTILIPKAFTRLKVNVQKIIQDPSPLFKFVLLCRDTLSVASKAYLDFIASINSWLDDEAIMEDRQLIAEIRSTLASLQQEKGGD